MFLAITGIAAALCVQSTEPAGVAARTDISRSDYASSGAARILDWSEEHGMVFRWWGSDGAGQAYSVRAAGAESVAITEFDSFISGWAPRPGRTGQVLSGVFEAENRRFQTVLGDLESGAWETVGLTEFRSSRPRWHPDGQLVASNYRDPAWDYAQIVQFDPQDMATLEVLWEAPAATSPVDWSPDGSALLLITYNSNSDHELRVLDMVTRSVTRIDDPDTSETFIEPRFSTSADYVLTASDAAAGIQSVGRLHFDGRFEPLFEDAPGEVEDWLLSADRDAFVVVYNQGGVSVLHAGADRQREIRALEGLPAGVIDSVRYSPDEEAVGVVVQAWSGPGEGWSVPLDGGEAERWFALPGAQDVPLVEPVIEQFETFDRVDGAPRLLDAVVWAETNAENAPVLIYLHGGPAAQVRPTFVGDFQYYAAAQGMAVIAPNVRGSEGYGREFLTLDDGAARVDAVRDVGAILDWIARDGRFDSDRAVLMGHSYGGLLSLATATQYPDQLSGVIAYSAPVDLINLVENRSESLRAYTQAEYGDVSDPRVREALAIISPLQNVSSIDLPVLVAHGTEDDREPVEVVDDFVDHLRALGREVEYLRLDGEGHGITGEAGVARVEQSEAAFLRRILLD